MEDSPAAGCVLRRDLGALSPCPTNLLVSRARPATGAAGCQRQQSAGSLIVSVTWRSLNCAMHHESQSGATRRLAGLSRMASGEDASADFCLCRWRGDAVRRRRSGMSAQVLENKLAGRFALRSRGEEMPARAAGGLRALQSRLHPVVTGLGRP